MVHALEEAARVLKPDGLLVELRPAPRHRRVWLVTSERSALIGRMHEDLGPDHAADAALARFMTRAQLRARFRRRTVCNRYVDSLTEFREFLEEFEDCRHPTAPHRRLLERVERAWTVAQGRRRIMITGPLQMTVLQKLA
jgi:SAM-dependent methyltransferase